MRRSFRKGFTLIELMVVIGIILLLVSIVVFGLRHVNATAARHETIAEMNICAGMLKEYESINGPTNIEGGLSTIPKVTVPISIQPPVTQDVLLPVYSVKPSSDPSPPPSFITSNDLYGGPSGDFGDRGGPQEPRYIAPVIYRTRAVMFILLKDSKNRITLSAVPPKRILEGPPASDGTATSIPADYGMVLDGWGNPIIYVPKGGMLLWMSPSGQGANYLVRSSGTYISDANGGGSMLPPFNDNDRPFFASPGQDGVFTDPQQKTDNGVDNIYSFQQ